MSDQNRRGMTLVTIAPLFHSENKNMISGNGIKQQPRPCVYWEDIDKKDQGWALLDEGSMPPVPDEDGPIIMGAIAPSVGEDDRTYKTPSK
jgi:hypothetical protein